MAGRRTLVSKRFLMAMPLVFLVSLCGPAPFVEAQEAASGKQPTFTTQRHAYERGEVCTLRLDAPRADSVEFDIDGWLPFRVEVKEGTAEYALDTSVLRAQDYTVRARLISNDEVGATVTFPLTIAPKHDDERLPVWRWGYPNPDWWEKRGFTGGFVSARKDPASTARPLELQRQFDKATRHDFELGFYIYPLLSPKWKDMESVGSLRPDGTRHEKPCPLEPAVMEHAKATVESWVESFAEYPGLRHVMLQSEWQQPHCVNEVVALLCKEETGQDIREFITEKGGLKGFDASTIKDGLIEDDHPHYRFLQWWWQRGHGTVVMNEMMHDIVKSHRPDLMTWHEPYRLAPVRHSHKGLDCIGTWTYGYPDIKRLCYTTYLQAAARPEGQLVQQDITLFVYGRFVMPLGESTADYSNDFAGKDPFFTAGPDYTREAMWLVLSQRPDVLCFYSAGKFSPDRPAQDPHYIAPETFDAIGETCEYLVKPYGPTILACRRMQPEVAVLMSAASTWLKVSPRLPGYPTEQTLPYASLLMMNHVPFDVVLDEDVAEGALANYSTLVMPRADTLTRTMHAEIKEFAGDGGTVIADASLRAEIPGAKVTQFDMTHQMKINGKDLAKGEAVTAEEDRAIMEGYAKELATLLEEVARPSDSVSPRVLTNSLDGGAAQYHFFVNDDRTYGPRFGQWKLRFELGVPQTAQVSVALGERSVLYDALRRERIDYETNGDRAVFSLRLPAARGALIAALPEPIGGVRIEAPAEAVLGEPVPCTIQVMGESGAPIDGVLPLRIDVIDAIGRKTEWRRYTKTNGGKRSFSFTPGINDPKGEWTIRVTDLIAGTTAEATVHCSGD